MTQSELIDRVSKMTGYPKKEVKSIIEALFTPAKGIIIISLKEGEKVTIPGFGTFFLRKRKARVARNPKSGLRVNVEERAYLAFKASKTLKEALKKVGD